MNAFKNIIALQITDSESEAFATLKNWYQATNFFTPNNEQLEHALTCLHNEMLRQKELIQAGTHASEHISSEDILNPDAYTVQYTGIVIDTTPTLYAHAYIDSDFIHKNSSIQSECDLITTAVLDGGYAYIDVLINLSTNTVTLFAPHGDA